MKDLQQYQRSDRTLQRRQQMSMVLEDASKIAPRDMRALLTAIYEAYSSGNIPRFWDVLAALAGSDRGYGNGFFYTALEIQKQAEEAKYEAMSTEEFREYLMQ